jgi:hypothetical protein
LANSAPVGFLAFGGNGGAMGLLAFSLQDEAFGFALHKVLLVASLAEQVACLSVLYCFDCCFLVLQKEKVRLGRFHLPAERCFGLLGIWT